MDLHVGRVYRFWKSMDDFWIVKIIDDPESRSDSYVANVLEKGEGMKKGLLVGMTGRIFKSGILFRDYHIHPMYTYGEQPETESEITYTPELINLYIDMSLQTGDKEWFCSLVQKQKEMVV